MKQVKHRNSASKILILGTVFLFTFFNPVFAQDEAAVDNAAVTEASSGGDVAKGEELFKSLCAACHKRYKKAVGPALFGVADKYDKAWIYSWIKNSAAMVASGDAQAVAIFEEYNKTAMNAFPQLTDGNIDDILAYVMEPKADPPAPVPGSDTASGGGEKSGVSANVVLAILALVFLMLMVVLFLVNRTLRTFAEANNVELPQTEARTPIWKAFIQNQFLVIVTAIFLLLASGYFVYGYFMQVGVDQGYQPVQPIHYSHKIHAGDNKIECKYCHSSARVSKTSGIPSLNVCMNCHKSISEVADATATEEHSKEFYDGEIQKLYKAVGWDADSQSYTGETEPVKWVRIHNLPDFAYFNHSQHVSVAGVECQTCHGPVEEMEIMYQHAPLTMGWCINCHRDTNVKVADNKYYEKIHKELSKKYGVDQLTAAQMGGLECGKCHY
ncbi:quinol:cytochrome c oxidoreductase pentaheme cytochrome subunit [Aquimarina sp. MAR_2010_214]|uniref:c-type cytochrome n=1 Tax=Aquimarina sp. MAR_2010_214 TaxID=1250026 RepID=UPI000C70D397|nr:c-type cytochrome [Aquimarina sp. MAR_2010_214]PKV49435.1 quinol:cytochrome c oxidoreductase pentaheme cytochrome subunit [Aquimarina sp. MAR_2010_214]